MNTLKLTVAALAATVAFAGAAAARDQIQVAGSSTVLPYAKIVAESFGETFTNFKTPVVESGGTGAGLKEFCKGVGEDTIDVANASRPINKNELEACKAAGVTDIQEVKIGYDGIVFGLATLAVAATTVAWPLPHQYSRYDVFSPVVHFSPFAVVLVAILACIKRMVRVGLWSTVVLACVIIDWVGISWLILVLQP